MKLKFVTLDTEIDLFESNIYSINFQKRDVFLKLIEELKESNDDKVYLVEDNLEHKKVFKNSIFLDSYFSLDINSKKSLTNLQDRIFKEIDVAVRDELSILLSNVSSILTTVSKEIPGELFYDQLTIQDVIKVMNFKYDDIEKENIVLFFSQFLNMLLLSKIKTVFTYDFLKLLTDCEIELINKELSLREMKLIDLTFNSIVISSNYIKKLTYDEDDCVY